MSWISLEPLSEVQKLTKHYVQIKTATFLSICLSIRSSRCGIISKQAVREAATICPRLPQVDLWHFDLERGIRVTCDVGYLCANFSLPRSFCSRLRPDVRDRQTDVRPETSDVRRASSLNAPTLGAGHNRGIYRHCSFFSPTAIISANRNPFTRKLKQGVEKICYFRTKSLFISETLRDRPVVTMKVIGSQPIHFGIDDLEWPWKARCEGSFSWQISVRKFVTFELEQPNLAR